MHGCERLFGPGLETAHQIKARIKRETGLTGTVGVAPNKLLAKLASDHGKPDALVVVSPERVSDFLVPLPVGRIWGVGKKAEKRLHALGIRTIGHLAGVPEQILMDHFGQLGHHVWQLAHGPDERRVVPAREAKSISTETTFPEDIADREVLRDWLLDLMSQQAGRLRHAGRQAEDSLVGFPAHVHFSRMPRIKSSSGFIAHQLSEISRNESRRSSPFVPHGICITYPN